MMGKSGTSTLRWCAASCPRMSGWHIRYKLRWGYTQCPPRALYSADIAPLWTGSVSVCGGRTSRTQKALERDPRVLFPPYASINTIWRLRHAALGSVQPNTSTLTDDAHRIWTSWPQCGQTFHSTVPLLYGYIGVFGSCLAPCLYLTTVSSCRERRLPECRWQLGDWLHKMGETCA